jgi:(1->4)-alpha-D-glucan 1-alpha-D-glucosylmutase
LDDHGHPDAPEPVPLFVEKILTGDETLPPEWPVDGTTGYEFMNEVGDLVLDPDGYSAIEANYRGLRHNPSLAFDSVAHEGKRHVLRGALRADVQRVARLASAWSKGAVETGALARAVTEVIVHLPVYRTYVRQPGVVRDADRGYLEAALAGAGTAEVEPAAIELLRRAFFDPPNASDQVRAELVARFQQASGPAAAKGVEDTALYVYVPLAQRNEVGGAPGRPLDDAPDRLHERNAARARRWPRGLNATNTHDTKRSADVRSRLAALSDTPVEWARHVSRWRKLNRARKRTVRGKPAPDTNAEYLFYQALVGLWPAPRPQRRVDDLPDAGWMRQATDRLSAYMLKAAREAKTRTSWTEADDQYEKALEAFVRESLAPSDDAHFPGDVARLTAAIADAGFARACARIMVHLMSPGVPDLYQGDELWSFTLVDPDNRRPVDFDRAASLLAKSGARPDTLRDAFGGTLGEDRVKQALTARLLRFRREHAELVGRGAYLPLTMEPGLFAFARECNDEVAIAIARTRSSAGASGGVRGVQLSLPGGLAGRWNSVLTGRDIELVRNGDVTTPWADELIPVSHPCELLVRTRR